MRTVQFDLDDSCSFSSGCRETEIVIKKSLSRNLLKFKSAFDRNCNQKKLLKYLTIELILIAIVTNSFNLNASHLALSKLRAKIVFLFAFDHCCCCF